MLHHAPAVTVFGGAGPRLLLLTLLTLLAVAAALATGSEPTGLGDLGSWRWSLQLRQA
jgi:hypothetical protein